ncbi:MAG TPA: hypothetical protein VMF30_12520 [Pirellulales bacterium]|nr:hypothetical protein [Pirellulales bacterium]
MSANRFFMAVAVTSLALLATGTASAQINSGGAAFGGMAGINTFSPVTGAAPMGGMGGMNAQQMAQIYMMYGMMGMGGNRGVVSGVPNPIVTGGFGSLPYIDDSTQQGQSNHAAPKNSSAARKAAARAERAEQKNQAKLAKAKSASKTSRKKNAAAQQ